MACSLVDWFNPNIFAVSLLNVLYLSVLENAECESNPCGTGGTCFVQSDGNYTCACDFGYYGQNCQFRKTRCSVDYSLQVVLPVCKIFYFKLHTGIL